MNINVLVSSFARKCKLTTASPTLSLLKPAVTTTTTSSSSSSSSIFTYHQIFSNCKDIHTNSHVKQKISPLLINSIVKNNLNHIQKTSFSLFHTFTSPPNQSLKQPSLSNSSLYTYTPKRSMASQKHKRIIKMAKGYRGRAKNTFRAAIRRVEKGLQYAYRDRKMKKRNFRKLWIERINAGVRQHGMSYSRFINGMMKMNEMNSTTGVGEGIGGEVGKKIVLNRKVLADLAANEPFSFKAVVDVVKMHSVNK